VAGLALRPFDRKHLDQTRAWVNDPELMRLLDRARPVAELEHEQWFAHLHEKSGAIYFAIETDGQHIGNVWLWDIDGRHRKAELRIMIGASDATGKGIGTEAINLVCKFAFERLNLHKIYVYVLDINPRAKRAFEKAGFVVEGTLKADRWMENRYIDVYLMGRLAL
jgi:RimJ/RimL family protein N-acetyltransferase